MASSARKSSHRLAWLLFAAAILLAAAAFWHAARRPLPVQVASARVGPLVVTWSADADCSGTIVRIAAEVPGRIELLAVQEGSRVKRGDVIAIIGRTQAEAKLRAAQAELRRLEQSVPASIAAARAELDAARAALQRLLAGSRPEEIEAARAEARAAEMRAESLRARVREMQATLQRERQAVEAEVKQAEAAVARAKALLDQAKRGPREEEIKAAEAELRGAEAAAERAARELKRQRALLAQQATSRSAVDAAEEAYKRARAHADALRQRLEQLRRGTRPEQIRAAEAAFQAAQAQLAEAKAHARRVQELEEELSALRAELRAAEDMAAQAAARARIVEKGPRQEEIRTARARVRQAEANLRAAEAGRAQLDAARAAVQQARDALDKCTVRAPADGEIARKLVEQGDYVAPGQPIAELVAAGSIWVTALVDDQDIGKVRLGQKVDVLAEAYPGMRFRGVVKVIAAAAQPKGAGRVRAKVVPVRIEVRGAEGYLRPGMELDVEGRTRLRESAVLVPTDALVHEAGQWFVWTLRAGRAHRQRVQIGETTATETEITSGLSGGETVILSPKEKLREGLPVRPIKAAQPGGG